MTRARRFRPPSSTMFLFLLSAIVGAVAVVAIVLAVVAYGRLDPSVTRIDGLTAENQVAIRALFAARRESILRSCESAEEIKRDTRRVLRTFGVTDRKLPVVDGRRVFDPTDCRRRARELVPSILPKHP